MNYNFIKLENGVVVNPRYIIRYTPVSIIMADYIGGADKDYAPVSYFETVVVKITEEDYKKLNDELL